jgi:hypothetical protein
LKNLKQLLMFEFNWMPRAVTESDKSESLATETNSD